MSSFSGTTSSGVTIERPSVRPEAPKSRRQKKDLPLPSIADVAERGKPQDGSVEATIHDRTFKLRLATTSTPSGESLIIRILNPEQKPESLEDLGMSEEQTRQMQPGDWSSGRPITSKRAIKKEVLLSRMRKVLENNPPSGAHPVPPGIGSILEHAHP